MGQPTEISSLAAGLTSSPSLLIEIQQNTLERDLNRQSSLRVVTLLPASDGLIVVIHRGRMFVCTVITLGRAHLTSLYDSPSRHISWSSDSSRIRETAAARVVACVCVCVLGGGGVNRNRANRVVTRATNSELYKQRNRQRIIFVFLCVCVCL